MRAVDLSMKYRKFMEENLVPCMESIIKDAERFAVEIARECRQDPDTALRAFYEVIIDVCINLLIASRQGVVEVIKNVGENSKAP